MTLNHYKIWTDDETWYWLTYPGMISYVPRSTENGSLAGDVKLQFGEKFVIIKSGLSWKDFLSVIDCEIKNMVRLEKLETV
jgi:hypothetical protein